MLQHQTWHQRERRYQLERRVAERALLVLDDRLPRLVYDPGAAKTFVVTVYLDTPDHHYLRICEAGKSARSLKLRIREYLSLPAGGGELRAHDSCYLERKERLQDVRLKQRVKLTKEQVGAVLQSRSLANDSTEAHALGAELTSLQLSPVLVSIYERVSFGDDRLRVTFDERLAYYPPPERLYDEHPALTPEVLGAPLARGPSRILEIKYPTSGQVPDWLETELAGVSRADSFSKFRDGMRALDRSDGKPVRLSRPVAHIES